MTEHKILGLIESMAQKGEVMTEQKYKEIADLLAKKVNEYKRVYRITYIQIRTDIDRLDDEVLLLRNKPQMRQQLVELTKAQHDSIENDINKEGCNIADHYILQNNVGCLQEIDFGSSDDVSATVRVISAEVMIVRIVPV